MSGTRDHTFAKPTVEDFSALVAWHIDKSLQATGQEIGRVTSEHVARGVGRSGITIGRTFEVAHEQFDSGLDAVLGELKRAIRTTSLDKEQLREIAVEKLRDYAEAMKVATGADKMRSWAGHAFTQIDERLAVFDEKLTFALRQFDVGFKDPPEPEMPPSIVNRIDVGHMSGGAVQQGTVASQQNVSSINITVVAAAVEAFDREIAKSPLPQDIAAEVKADLDTIKSQLAKQTPSDSILKEAGSSLKNVLEGAAGGALAPAILSGGEALLKALWLM